MRTRSWTAVLLLFSLVLLITAGNGCQGDTESASTEQNSTTKGPSVEAVVELDKALFDVTMQHGSINNLERLVAVQHSISSAGQSHPHREEVYQRLWDLTREADVWDRYTHFLKEHADAPPRLVEVANQRICDFGYAAAKKEHSLEGYVSFLNTFPTASDETRQAALANASALVEAAIKQDEFDNRKPADVDRDTRTSVGLKLLNEGLEAKRDNKDEVTLLVHEQVIRESPYFDDTIAKTEALLREEVINSIEAIQAEIEMLRSDIQQLRASVINGMEAIRRNQHRTLARIVDSQNTIIDEVARQQDLPFAWDIKRSRWENISDIAAASLPYIAKAALSKLLR